MSVDSSNRNGAASTRQVAEAVRQACLKAAGEAYDDARMRGLCQKGAWELALDAVRSLDLNDVLADL